ncbi:glycoside hydrolase family 53 protein [Marinifilum caeruleilacunae]|uniref:Arabinogalactan endo-beta-1,4-galactanase n=1 Tax=Marinifilum caeruleilacunae TaxID=2499076 RepID=A0ABX1WSG2_9BACT|nr:glycosyl hydrolase 53 family protein [Marinifilum caeruleilacunae]NOU58927.1 arabinogalactan endo-1,4-beta-galactosidase [Marinifilum caeruleilacunae]
MRYIFLFLPIYIALFSGCSDSNDNSDLIEEPKEHMISGADLSFLPQIEDLGLQFYDNGVESDMLSILKQHGLNTVRIRLWHTPENPNSSLQTVKEFARRVKDQDMDVWLCVHYSDTWADPGHQVTPEAWTGLDFNTLKDSLYNYTEKIMREIQPDYIQIGNEVNPGFLLPQGDRFEHPDQFEELLNTGIQAVRNQDEECKIMIHYAGYSDAYSFYNEVDHLDYDMIALSYYPQWHGKNLTDLQSKINNYQIQFSRKVIIAETAYPFTLKWNDHTTNIIGEASQLILPDYPATPEGQKQFLDKIKDICIETNNMGFCYWGAEYVAFQEPGTLHGSSWENQALFDFNNEALPAVESLNLK